MTMRPDSKIYIAGHNGLVGSAIWRNLESRGFSNIIGKSSKELDLRDQIQVETFFKKEKPEFVFLAAAKVGGILANDTYRAQFIHENLMIQNNVIHFAHVYGVKKFLFIGSSCIYPRDCPQPIKEEYLLTGSLEQTNEPYAIAKIAGIKMCENYYRQYGSQFFSIMPTNTYGPNDNYNLETSHVLPAMIRKIYLAKCLEDGNYNLIRNNLNTFLLSSDTKYNPNWSNEDLFDILNLHGISLNAQKSPIVKLWGTGKPLREFIHVDDLGLGALFVMNLEFDFLYKQGYSHLNIGSGTEISIAALSKTISEIIGFNGQVIFDNSKPDGTMRKLLDVSKIKDLGWESKIDISEGIKNTFQEW